MVWIADQGPRDALGRLLVDAAEALVADEQQSIDNFAWFRATHDEEERHRDGLVLDGQGFGALELGVAKLLPPASRVEGDRFWVDRTRDVHTATAAAYGVITVPEDDDTRARRLEAGRLLQRLHLRATSLGVALQHMNQITERLDREAATETVSELGPRFAALLPTGARPLLTFRVGLPERPARPSTAPGGRGRAAVTRARLAGHLGALGGVLLAVAGAIQIVFGRDIPEWTGNKLAPVPLGALTVVLAAVTLLAAHRARRPDDPPGVRAVVALGLAGPGLLCLSTVGVLAWLPALLLTSAGVLAVAGRWRATAGAVTANRYRILLGALGCCQFLMAAAAAPLPTAAAVVGGAALLLAAALPRPGPAPLAGLVALGVVPLAVVGWAAVVPLVVAVVAIPIAVLRARGDRPHDGDLGAVRSMAAQEAGS